MTSHGAYYRGIYDSSVIHEETWWGFQMWTFRLPRCSMRREAVWKQRSASSNPARDKDFRCSLQCQINTNLRKLTFMVFSFQNAIAWLVQAKQTGKTFPLSLTQPHTATLPRDRAVVTSTTPRFSEGLAGRNIQISPIAADHSDVQVVIRYMVHYIASCSGRESFLASCSR